MECFGPNKRKRAEKKKKGRGKQGLCDNLEGWGIQGDGRQVQEEGDMGVPVADSIWQKTTKFCKANILQLKK